MKSALYLLRLISIFFTIAMVMLLAACGQKGPLYLPEKPAVATPPASSPALTSLAAESPANPASK